MNTIKTKVVTAKEDSFKVSDQFNEEQLPVLTANAKWVLAVGVSTTVENYAKLVVKNGRITIAEAKEIANALLKDVPKIMVQSSKESLADFKSMFD